jgi:preprotein translocase subunit SecD
MNRVLAGLLIATVMATPVLAQHTIVLDVRSASVAPDDMTGQPALKISLSPDGAKAFGDFTGEHVGETIDILVDGAVVTSPRLMTPIHSDWIIVTGPFSGTELDAMADAINRGRSAVTVRGEKTKSAD